MIFAWFVLGVIAQIFWAATAFDPLEPANSNEALRTLNRSEMIVAYAVMILWVAMTLACWFASRRKTAAFFIALLQYSMFNGLKTVLSAKIRSTKFCLDAVLTFISLVAIVFLPRLTKLIEKQYDVDMRLRDGAFIASMLDGIGTDLRPGAEYWLHRPDICLEPECTELACSHEPKCAPLKGKRCRA